MQSQHQPSPPIVFLDSNERGSSDYVIADIHGKIKCFDRLLSELTPNDRLFIAGDIFDRGEDNVLLIETLFAARGNPALPTIYAIRGNHEQMALDTILEFEQLLVAKKNHKDYARKTDFLYTLGLSDRLAEAFDSDENNDLMIDPLEKAKMHAHKTNGGMWLRELYMEELHSHAIYYKDGQIRYSAESKIEKIKKLIESMPYVIHVTTPMGENDYMIGHAAIPFNDVRLQHLKMDANPTLTAEEIEYLLWARTNKSSQIQIEYTNRNPLSTFALVGHNIFANAGNSAAYPAIATANLDGGSYLFDCAVCVCMHDGSVRLVPNDANIPITVLHKEAYKIINAEETAAALSEIESRWPAKYPMSFRRFSTEILEICKLLDFQATLKNEIIGPLVQMKTAVELDEKIHALVSRPPLPNVRLTYKNILQCLINNSALRPDMAAQLADAIRIHKAAKRQKLNPAQQFAPSAIEARTQESKDDVKTLTDETPSARGSHRFNQK